MHNSHHARSQAVARSAVSVEIDRHVDCSLKLRHQRSHASRIDQTCHILDGNHLGTEGFITFSFFYEIFVGKYLFRIYVVVFRINSVAYSAIGYAAKLIDDFHRFLNVVEVVKGVENTHNAKTVLDGFYIETLDDVGRIWGISEKVSTTRKGSKIRAMLVAVDFVANRFETIPRRFVEVTHHRIRYSSTPYFHCIKTCIYIVRKENIDARLRQTSCK